MYLNLATIAKEMFNRIKSKTRNKKISDLSRAFTMVKIRLLIKANIEIKYDYTKN